MTKHDAIKIFGTVANLAEAIGITVHAIYQWPDVLKRRTADEVRGAALRLERDIPESLLGRGERAA